MWSETKWMLLSSLHQKYCTVLFSLHRITCLRNFSFLLYERQNDEKIHSLEQDKSLLEARVATLEQLIQEYQTNIETLKAEILKVSWFFWVFFFLNLLFGKYAFTQLFYHELVVTQGQF